MRCLPRQQEMVRPFCLEWLFSSSDGALMAEDSEEESPPPAPSVQEAEPDDPWQLMEWPPSPCRLNVFSSRTGRWEERTFVREGEPAGIVADLRLDRSEPAGTVYWKGSLYVHCRGAFVIRYACSLDFLT